VSRERVADEGAAIADTMLTMAIRAIDYTPPIHIEFGDYLSALLTADREVRNDDSRYRLRARLLDSFASFGIAPGSGTADGTWTPPTAQLARGGAHFSALQGDTTEMFRLVWANRKALKLNPEAFTRVVSLRPAFRVSPDDGFQIRETVAECTQYLRIPASQLGRYGLRIPAGMPPDQEVVMRGGSTLILDEYGELKYEVYNHIPTSGRQQADRLARSQRRLDYMWEYGYFDPGASLTRGLPALHRARSMGLVEAAGRRLPTGLTTRGERWT
jgi:hypothetical protein